MMQRTYPVLRDAAAKLIEMIPADGRVPGPEDTNWHARLEATLQTISREWQRGFPDGRPSDWEITNDLCRSRDALRSVSGPLCDSAFNEGVGNRKRQKPTRLKDVQPVCIRVANKLNELCNAVLARNT